MIQKLIEQIITLLIENFAGVINLPENENLGNHIVAGPVSEPNVENLPMIAAYPEKLEISNTAKETSSSQPRPQEFQQEIPVNDTTPAGPYSLAKTPLRKSTICKIIFNKGEVTERQMMLVEDKDFTINHQNATILFSYDLSRASHILLKYSFVGVFTMREFQQEFMADIYDDDRAEVEKLGSLVTAIVLTNHDELIEMYNFTDKTEYLANQFITSHSLDQIHILGGVPVSSGSNLKLQLKFKAVGQLKLAKEITEGFGLIEKIHSPGKISEEPVDIEIGVE